jgi:hypothetical protein
MSHPEAWESERTLVEITQRFPVPERAEKTDWEHERLETLPYDSLIEQGRYAGGHVLMLHADGTTQLWAVPPEVIPLLQGMLPDDQYRLLIERTPKIASLASKP